MNAIEKLHDRFVDCKASGLGGQPLKKQLDVISSIFFEEILKLDKRLDKIKQILSTTTDKSEALNEIQKVIGGDG